MNNCQQISPVIVDDSQLETEFACVLEVSGWRIEAKFRFHATARCVRIAVENSDTQRCVNLRADRSETIPGSERAAGFNTAHLMLIDNQIPWAYSLDFQALQRGIAVADWVSRFLCLTAEKPAIEAQKAIETMCAELGRRLATGGIFFSSSL